MSSPQPGRKFREDKVTGHRETGRRATGRKETRREDKWIEGKGSGGDSSEGVGGTETIVKAMGVRET